MPSWRARSSAMALKRKAVFLCLLVLSPVCSGDICREDRDLTVTEGDQLSLTFEVANKNRVDVYWHPDGKKPVHLGLCHSVYKPWSCTPKDFCKLDVLGQSEIKLTIRQDLLSGPGGTVKCLKHWEDGESHTGRVEQSCRIRVKPRESTTTEPTTTPVATTRTPSPTPRPFTTSALTVAARNGADNDNDINDDDDSMPMALIIGVTVGTLLVIIVIIAIVIIVFKRRRGSKKCSARSTDRNASNRIIGSVESANDFRDNGDDFNPTRPLPSTSRGPDLPTNHTASSVPRGVDDLNLQSPPGTSHNLSTYEDVEMGLYSTVDGEDKASPPQAQNPQPQVGDVYAVVMKPKPGGNPQPKNNQALNQSPPRTSHNPSTNEDVEMGLYSTVDGEDKASPPRAQSPEPQVYAVVMKPRRGGNPQPNNNSNNQALNQPPTPNLSATPDPDEAKGGNCPAEETYAQVQKKKKKKKKTKNSQTSSFAAPQEPEGEGHLYAEVKKPKRGALKSRVEAGDVCEKPVSTDPGPSAVRARLEKSGGDYENVSAPGQGRPSTADD